MIRLLVGLGNPGAKHTGDRHNVGFWLADDIAGLLEAHFSERNNTLVATAGDLRIAKPQAFMNRSGSPVQQLCHYFKIAPKEVMVAHDDLDLPVGIIRLKRGGGHGGHNGLRDLIAHIGADFHRLRIGIGHPGDKSQVHNHVLSAPTLTEKQAITEALKRAEAIHQDWLRGDIARAQHILHTN